MKYIPFLLVSLIVVIILSVFAVITTNKYNINTNSTAVVEQIRSLNRLETADYSIEKIIDAGTNGGTFKQLLFGDRLLLIAHGDVIAGVDLSKLQKNNVQIDQSTITMTLPPTEILVSKLDESQTRVYDRQLGLLTKGDQNLESEARKAAESSITKAACTDGILKIASDNAQKQLTATLKGLGFATVIVHIQPGSC